MKNCLADIVGSVVRRDFLWASRFGVLFFSLLRSLCGAAASAHTGHDAAGTGFRARFWNARSPLRARKSVKFMRRWTNLVA